MTRKTKVLLFLTVPFRLQHGGVLWAKTLLENMARLQRVHSIIVSAGTEDTRSENQKFADSLGLQHIFIAFRQHSRISDDTRSEHSRSTLRCALNCLIELAAEKYYFYGERARKKQGHVDAAVLTLLKEQQPDLLLIDNTYSAFFVPSAFTTAVPCCLITQENDLIFYTLLKSFGGQASMNGLELWISRRFNWISNFRIRRHVNWIYQRCAGLVTLTKNDMPGNLPSGIVKAVIPPVLRNREERWRYQASRCVLFVGNIFSGNAMHFANRLAIEWICKRMAPELMRIDPTIRINIIGASAHQVPESWHCRIINFMGAADKHEVVRQMTSADIFVAPIATNFGAKMKLAECVAHGAPFLATSAAMSGLPFLSAIPKIELDKPHTAAQLIAHYVTDPSKLERLSDSILVQAQRAMAEQDAAWQSLIERCAAPRPRDPGLLRDAP